MTAGTLVLATFGLFFASLGIGSYALRAHFDRFSLGIVVTASLVFSTYAFVGAFAQH